MSDIIRKYCKQDNKEFYKYTNNSSVTECFFLYKTGEISGVQNLDEFLCKISSLSDGLRDKEIKFIVKNINNIRAVPSIDEFNQLGNDENNFIIIPLRVKVQERVKEDDIPVRKNGNNHELIAVIRISINNKIIKLDIFDTNGDIAKIFNMNNREKTNGKKTIYKNISKKQIEIEQYYYYNNVIQVIKNRINYLNKSIGLNFELETRIISKSKIQMSDGCTFNSINFIRIAKDCIDANDLEQQITSGEMQFKVMAETSKQMQPRTGNIQIIKNLGQKDAIVANVVINGEENNRYIEFNLGNSRFAMSLSKNEEVIKNKYISRPGLIRTIGDIKVIEEIEKAINNNQQIFGEKIKCAVYERHTDLNTEEKKSNIIELGKEKILIKKQKKYITQNLASDHNYNKKTTGIDIIGLERTQSLPVIHRDLPQQQPVLQKNKKSLPFLLKPFNMEYQREKLAQQQSLQNPPKKNKTKTKYNINYYYFTLIHQ